MTAWAFFVGLLLMGLVWTGLADLRRRADHTEALLRRLLAAQGIDWPTAAPPSDEVRALARSGHTVEALRAYRQQTGLDLKRAKAVVDGLHRDSCQPSAAL